MADTAATLDRSPPKRAWIGLGVLAFAYVVCNLCIRPFNGRDLFVSRVSLGIAFLQPVLFAIWTVVGPPPAKMRVPLSLGAYAGAILAGSIVSHEWLSPDYALLAGLFFSAAALVSLLVRRITRLGIRNVRELSDGITMAGQFSLKYLIGITTLCALVLGLGRVLASPEKWTQSVTLTMRLSMMLTQLLIILLLMSTTIAPAIMALSKRPRAVVLVALPLLWAASSWIAIEAMIAAGSPPRSQLIKLVVAIQLGGLLVALVSAIILRLAGYRLVKSRA